MAMVIQLPTVTEADLHLFHSKHFPNAPAPTQLFHITEPAEEEHDHYEDGLGYYEDGVKRTLTDEQIALFRHTEIQTIIRERRWAREARESPEPTPPVEKVQEKPSPASNESQRKMSISSLSSPSTPMPAPKPNNGQDVRHDRVEKNGGLFRSNPRTQRKNKNRRRNLKKKQKEEKKKRRDGTMFSRGTEENELSEESDEWDPRRQAIGPDVQNDTTIDLDY
ncbi:hypothetical protein K469DRAFT_106518 [Zopfia rhizophila CBS 207.26]|uniref:Uncharacterized protein n=1 Tax=Zopfia rhizophila CBS 207.26 TaxID=1314779 RepID=A0A6A6EAE1_9PEZI|nr:hypothetical protein K469DRAFT_106518 [Zopfia rhizophila CBS 207.26]